MKVLITGNMGYVGPRVVRRLRTTWAGAELVGVDTGWFAPLLTNARVLPETLLDVHYFCDVRDISDEMLSGVDAVVHLAGVSNDPMGDRFEAATLDINVRGSARLAQRARRAGVRAFVFASSCSVYGTADQQPRNERAELAPLTAYAKSKIATERELETLASPHFRVTSLRFATACGMSERLRLDLVLNDFVAGAVGARKITILSDGTPWRPLIDVDDMARAVEWAIDRDRAPGGDNLVVNVGRTDANYSVRQLAEAVAEAIPGTTVSINPAAQPDRRSYRVDFSLFESLAPSHQPAVSLQGSIAALRDGLTAMGYSLADPRESPLIRLRTLSELQRAGLLSADLRWSAAAAIPPPQVRA
jgi:nucleoside-diphosphate-sugar epimerase